MQTKGGDTTPKLPPDVEEISDDELFEPMLKRMKAREAEASRAKSDPYMAELVP